MLNLEHLERCIEAILFASGDAIELSKLSETLLIDEKIVKNLIDRIRNRYAEQESPFEVQYLDHCCQMGVLPQYAPMIREALELRKNTPLTPAALEVLAVIAYNQPVTRSFIEQVRGVDCSSIVRGLVEKGLVEEAGRLNIPGKPLSYRTTSHFLRSFGMERLEQLPPIPEAQAEPDENALVEVEGQLDFFDEDF